ncbi:MAG: PorT family protein [Acidobacteria bacterium]|nr:PorT family protein [Acidobacteriota bacterium]
MLFRTLPRPWSLARRGISLLTLLSAAAAVALPQRLSFGVKAGAPFQDVVKSESWKGLRYEPQSGRYMLGPTAELLLGGYFSVELDLLYRPVKYRTHFADIVGEVAGSSWQFPLLGKVRLSRNMVAPYVAAGVAFNSLRGLKNLPELSDSSTSGWVFGLGLEGRLPIVRLSPEVRYTRWRKANLGRPADGFSLSNLNQLEALVGITF